MSTVTVKRVTDQDGERLLAHAVKPASELLT